MTLQAAPLLPFSAAFAGGIVAAFWVAPGPVAAIGLAAMLLALAAAALAGGFDRLAMVLLVFTVAALGLLRAASPHLPADHISRLTLGRGATIEGRLVEEPLRWAPDRTRLVLEVEAVREGLEHRSARGRIQVTVYGEMDPLAEGQRIALEPRLHPPTGFRNPDVFDYAAQLRRDGILLVGSARADRVTVLGADAPRWPVRVKRWAVATIGRWLPESSAALLAGLLLGERSALPREIDEAFRRAGVYHILAVSGFNIALLASSVFLSLSLLGVPRRLTAVVAGIVVVGFACVVGGQPSVLRATVMGLLLLLGVLLERESQLMNALALAGLALLVWNPTDAREPGFQLSFAATLGIVYLTPGATASLGAHGWPRWLAAAVAVSLGAQLAVMPVMLVHFNQLSIIGVAANLAVVPLAGAVTTIGMLALLVAAASEAAAGLLFEVLWLLLVGLRAVVWAAAAVPAAMIHVPAPTWGAVAAWYGVLALLPYVRALPWARGVAAGLLVLVSALSVWPWLKPHDGKLRVTFLDVGQGDAAFVEVPGGPRLLIDGGPGGARRFDVGERVLAPFLWNRAVTRLDVVGLSHDDLDHAGGLPAILRHFRIGEFWEGGRWHPGSEEVLAALARSRIPRRVLNEGERLWMGDALVRVLNPDGRTPASPNDDSLVLRLDWRGISLLLTGDLGWPGEARVLRSGAALRALVLKVGHHGSRFSSTEAFLGAVQARMAVISVGARNSFRHPTPEALARLEAAGARVYRTDRDGAVIVESDGVKLWVTRWARGTTDVFDLDGERPVDARP